MKAPGRRRSDVTPPPSTSDVIAMMTPPHLSPSVMQRLRQQNGKRNPNVRNVTPPPRTPEHTESEYLQSDPRPDLLPVPPPLIMHVAETVTSATSGGNVSTVFREIVAPASTFRHPQPTASFPSMRIQINGVPSPRRWPWGHSPQTDTVIGGHSSADFHRNGRSVPQYHRSRAFLDTSANLIETVQVSRGVATLANAATSSISAATSDASILQGLQQVSSRENASDLAVTLTPAAGATDVSGVSRGSESNGGNGLSADLTRQRRFQAGSSSESHGNVSEAVHVSNAAIARKQSIIRALTSQSQNLVKELANTRAELAKKTTELGEAQKAIKTLEAGTPEAHFKKKYFELQRKRDKEKQDMGAQLARARMNGMGLVYCEWAKVLSNEFVWDMRFGNKMTMEQIHVMRMSLSHELRGNRFVRRSIPGSKLRFPVVPGRLSIEKFGKKNAIELGMHRLSTNEGYIYDVRKVIEGAITAAGNWKNDKGQYVVQICGDGFKATRRMNLVNIGVRGFSGDGWYDSYGSLRKIAMLEGDESYSNLEEVYKAIQVVLDDMPNVKVFAGGDKVYHNVILGCSRSFQTKSYMCPMCYVHTKNLNSFVPSEIRTEEKQHYLCHLPCKASVRASGKLSEEVSKKFQDKLIDLLKKLKIAHKRKAAGARKKRKANFSDKVWLRETVEELLKEILGGEELVGFTCDGCEKVFNSIEDIINDPEPLDMEQYMNEHFNVTWRKRPLLHVEPMDMIVCLLHLLLSVSKSFWKTGVLKWLDSAEKETALNDALKRVGITVKFQRKGPANEQQRFLKSVKFTGTQSLAFLRNFDELHSIVQRDVEKQKESFEMASKFLQLYSEMYKCTGRANFEKRAEELQEEAVKFVKAMISWGCDESVTYYLHDLVHHVPVQIYNLPVNLTDASNDAVEYFNLTSKQGARGHSNFHMKPSAKRNGEMNFIEQVGKFEAAATALEALGPEHATTVTKLKKRRLKRKRFEEGLEGKAKKRKMISKVESSQGSAEQERVDQNQ